MPVATTPRQEVYAFIKTRLGSQMVDVELDPNDYESALDFSIQTYRQRAAWSRPLLPRVSFLSDAYLQVCRGRYQ